MTGVASDPMRTLVLGGTSFVGRAIVANLEREAAVLAAAGDP